MSRTYLRKDEQVVFVIHMYSISGTKKQNVKNRNHLKLLRIGNTYSYLVPFYLWG
jgi:hypothetical protein